MNPGAFRTELLSSKRLGSGGLFHYEAVPLLWWAHQGTRGAYVVRKLPVTVLASGLALGHSSSLAAHRAIIFLYS